MNTAICEQYKAAHPLDVACFFGDSSKINSTALEPLCEEILRSRPEDYELFRSQTYWVSVAVTLETRRRAKELALKHFPEEKLSYAHPSAVHGSMLAFLGKESIDGVEGIEAGTQLAQKFGLEFKEAECLWSALSVRRLDEHGIVALIGDDRGWGGGTYFIAVAYAPQIFVEVWSQDPNYPWYPVL